MAVFYTYGALVFFLVCGSCSSLREERAPTAWGDASAADSTYLALVQCGTKAAPVRCAGTIISETMVLTYSTCDETNTVVYAGFTSFDTSKDAPKGTQVRNVEKVDKHEDLKIFILKEPWQFTENVVGAVKLADTKSGRSPQDCTVLGHKIDGVIITPQKMVQQIGGKRECTAGEEGDAKLLYSKGANDQQKLGVLDIGGPAVNNKNELLAINMECKIITGDPDSINCNTYIKIAEYRAWIEGVMTGKPVENEGSNNSTASSGYSIHSYLNKYSNWKVLGFLVPTIVTFLQY